MVGLLVNIIQNTTIAFVIGVNEFLQAGNAAVREPDLRSRWATRGPNAAS